MIFVAIIFTIIGFIAGTVVTSVFVARSVNAIVNEMYNERVAFGLEMYQKGVAEALKEASELSI